MKTSYFAIIVALVVCMRANAFAAEDKTVSVRDEQKCGENCVWTIKDDTFIVSGTGEMTDYDWQTHAPWQGLSYKHLVIEKGITSVGDNCFYGSNLSTLTIGEDVISIGDSAFRECKNLETLVIPDTVELLKEGAFADCTGLKNLSIGKKVKWIPKNGFISCSSLQTLVIPDTVTVIGDYSFEFARSLSSLTIGENVETIGISAFSDCNSLTSVVIPDSVTYIGENAFYYSYTLQNVTIGANVETIERNAFGYYIKSVFYKGTREFSEMIFYTADYLKNVCVRSDYGYTTFGTVNVTSNSSLCQEFQGMFNNCYTPEYSNGALVNVKRKNATEFESKTNGCVEYRCNNDTEPSTIILCKGDTPMCIKDSCHGSDALDDFKVRVELDLSDGVKVDLINDDEIKETLRTQFGIDPDKVGIGYVLKDDGSILRVSLYLNDVDLAHVVCDSFNNNSVNATGLLRNVIRARVIGGELSLSQAQNNHVMITSLIGVLLVLFFEMSQLF